ncbi:MAG TPA: SDR family oxidoreductase [Candidatus Saccharimonadales bacterium]|jgi:short-subunit dehydrogenase|nr:SDR family oxidoreductase [Candidatus Saccharimonadales bacterium]
MKQDQKVILITGAATGIGRATALTLAARGHKVIATSYSRESLAELERAAQSQNLTLTYDVLDITNTAQVQEVAQKYLIDVLLNNAAIGDTGPIVEVPLDHVRRNFEVNVVGTLGVIQAVVPQMIARKQGRIIVMSSMVGVTTPMFMNPYAGTKAALESFCDSMRNELAYFNIDVSAINPGRVDGGHNAKIAATKYEWLAPNSPYYSLIEEMKRHDHMLLDNAYGIDTVVPYIVKAIEAAHPKTHYAAPFKYRLGLFFNRLLPSRARDWVFFKATRLKFLK